MGARRVSYLKSRNLEKGLVNMQATRISAELINLTHRTIVIQQSGSGRKATGGFSIEPSEPAALSYSMKIATPDGSIPLRTGKQPSLPGKKSGVRYIVTPDEFDENPDRRDLLTWDRHRARIKDWVVEVNDLICRK